MDHRAYENPNSIAFDDEGHAPANAGLSCTYCDGVIGPVTEWELQERVVTGIECESCLAEWSPDGTPRKGPHRAFFAYEALVAHYAKDN